MKFTNLHYGETKLYSKTQHTAFNQMIKIKAFYKGLTKGYDVNI